MALARRVSLERVRTVDAYAVRKLNRVTLGDLAHHQARVLAPDVGAGAFVRPTPATHAISIQLSSLKAFDWTDSNLKAGEIAC